MQVGGGIGSGIADEEFEGAGAKMVKKPADVFAADMIIKVKEPLPEEYSLIRKGQVLYTYFHFAAARELTEAMVESGAICIAYETVEDQNGRLPLLTPMSEVAGRLSIQEGAKFLEKPMGLELKEADELRACCWEACRACPRRRWPSSAAASSAPTRPRSPRAWAPTSSSWT